MLPIINNAAVYEILIVPANREPSPGTHPYTSAQTYQEAITFSLVDDVSKLTLQSTTTTDHNFKRFSNTMIVLHSVQTGCYGDKINHRNAHFIVKKA